MWSHTINSIIYEYRIYSYTLQTCTVVYDYMQFNVSLDKVNISGGGAAQY